MDLLLTEEEELIKKNARDFLEMECPPDLARAMEADALGYPPELWRQMAELGWLGVTIPEQYGGSGGTMLDACLFMEETSRGLAPIGRLRDDPDRRRRHPALRDRGAEDRGPRRHRVGVR